MKITIEQVEKLQERSKVTYEEAKDALEKCDGDILEALIMLEKEGKTQGPQGGTYSTNGQNTNYGNDQQNHEQSYNNQNPNQGQNNQQQGPHVNYNSNQKQGSDFGKQVDSLWKSFCRLLHKGNINHFVMTKNGEEVMRMPVTVLIILLIIFNAAALILLIVLLFFGFKYSFNGPDLGKDSINNVMNSASETAEDLKDSAMNNNNGNQYTGENNYYENNNSNNDNNNNDHNNGNNNQ